MHACIHHFNNRFSWKLGSGKGKGKAIGSYNISGCTSELGFNQTVNYVALDIYLFSALVDKHRLNEANCTFFGVSCVFCSVYSAHFSL